MEITAIYLLRLHEIKTVFWFLILPKKVSQPELMIQ